MGSVWAAKLHGPHGFSKIVAMKTVLPELAGDTKVRAMFLDEARLASRIVHRNVAHVLDFLEHDGALYLVMEWVEGVSLQTLHERVAERGEKIPLGIALRIVADVCAGLHAAHELTDERGESCGLVHRDVSPHNVMVAIEGAAKLIDFGVAKTRFRLAPDSTLGALRGRLTFMAPEQAKGDVLDRRADVWSLGATLFHLVAGHGPFGPWERPETMRRKLLDAQPLPPPEGVPPSVARVLAGCLARRLDDRFTTAAEVGGAIEEAISDLGVSASAGDVAAFLAENEGVRLVSERWERGTNVSPFPHPPAPSPARGEGEKIRVSRHPSPSVGEGTGVRGARTTGVTRLGLLRLLASSPGWLAIAMALPIAGGAFASESSPPPRPAPVAIVDESAQTESAIIEVEPMVPDPASPPLPTLRGHAKTHAAAHAGGLKARISHDGRALAPK